MLNKAPAGFSTVAQLKALKPRAEPYEVKDETLTGGYVRVLKSGGLSYVFRYRFRNRRHKLFIGRFNADAGGLAEARKKARSAQNALTEARADADGVDPVTAMQRRRAEEREVRLSAQVPAAPPADLVERVVADFIELWARPHNRDWRETERLLNKEVVRRWAGRRLSEITSAEVRAALREITARAPIGANRTYGRFKRLCNWALEQEIIATSPLENIKALTPEKGHARERVLDDRELALVWRASEALDFPFGPISAILILTGQRRGEVAGMTWGELDLDERLWTIPATRSKNGITHAVALTEPVVAILQGLPRFTRGRGETDFVFSAGQTAPSGFSRAKRRLDEALLKIMRAADGDAEPLSSFVVHDFRRSVASGMARLGVELPVIERCLNHISGSFGGIVGVYQRHSYAEEMRTAFTRWATHVEQLTRDEPCRENVVALRG